MGKNNCLNEKKVMVAGHICLDITPVFLCQKIQDLNQILSPGKLVNVAEADVHTGGSVANTGLGMKILGANVCLAGKVGKDQFGQIIKNLLGEYDCEEGIVEDENSSTSYSVVLSIPGIDRIFLHNAGANNTFNSQDITSDMLEGISHFHFGYPSLMRELYINSGEDLYELFKFVKNKGITTSLDMAAIDPLSEAGEQDWHKILERIIPLVDFFVPSIEELGFMLDRKKYEEWNIRADGSDITKVLSVQKDIKPIADTLISMGAKVLLIKCGAPGMYFRTNSENVMMPLCKQQDLDIYNWSNQEGFQRSYYQKNIVSGTGAGDTSIAAFLTSMLSGKEIQRCVQLAAATGACCISTHDALSGLQPLEVLEKKIDDGWQQE